MNVQRLPSSSATWVLLPALFVLAASCMTIAQTSPPAAPAAGTESPPAESRLTTACDPCRFAIASGAGPFEFRFAMHDAADGGRSVERVEVARPDKPGWTQALSVHDMTPVGSQDDFFIGTADINFDGFNDLLVATSRGIANTYAAYWLYVPAKEEFAYLGNYPLFRVDATNQRLLTYERGGDGGMIYSRGQYRFLNGHLTLVESEKQEATKRPGVYRKTQSVLKDGTVQPVKTETVKAR